MAGVDQIEAAIGEADPQSLGVPPGGTLYRLVARGDLAVGRHQIRQIQHAEQFLAADCRGAGLAHGNAGRDVGEHRRLRQRDPGAEGHRQCRHQRIAGTRDIGHLARAGRQVQCRLTAPHQRQAFRRTRHQHRLAAGVVQRLASGSIGSLVVRRFDPGRLAHLKLVRRQHRGTAVGRELAALGIGDHHASACPRLCQCAPQHGVAQHALRIVGQQDHVCRRQRVGELTKHKSLGRFVDRRGGLLIEPQQLVMTDHESSLCRSRSPRNDHKMWNDTAACQQAHQFHAIRIVADDADQCRLATKGRDIQRDIRGTSECRASGTGPQHRDRCFRRQAACGPAHVAVEHHVAEHQHARIAKIANRPRQF